MYYKANYFFFPSDTGCWETCVPIMGENHRRKLWDCFDQKSIFRLRLSSKITAEKQWTRICSLLMNKVLVFVSPMTVWWNGSYSWRYQYLEAISMKTKGNRQIYQIVSMYLIILTSYFKKKRLQSLSCKQYWELVGSSSRLSVKDRQIKHFFSS